MSRTFFIFITIYGFIFLKGFSKTDSNTYQKRVKDMLDHAFDSYMKYAYPADELMPLSCKGRFRGSDVSRGDIDDSLGNFSLTLIDALDTLYLFKEYDKFEHSVKEVMKVTFDTDVEVSMFETNIRVLGGLLGGHISAQLVKENNLVSNLKWYSNQLLDLAVILANKLLPAFETATGISYSKINLKRGITKNLLTESYTCTACAGTFIMEFGVLSRLTGNPIYEEKARKALFSIFNHRNRHSDLVGTIINIHNGNWYSADSGVGASVDSYYEYLFKAYLLFGEETYLDKFQIHYAAIKKYIQDSDNLAWPYLFLNVELHRPLQRSRSFIDSLLAFWPGLTVIYGDIMDGASMHEMFHQIIKRHIFLPEAFTPDLKVYWGHHLLRPEFIESTYILYEATKDPYYLQIAADIVDKLENYTRVECGYAAIKDVRTLEKYDQMDSFFLAETLKYLYLIFTPAEELPIDLMDYVFTTEAHILPINLRNGIKAERSLFTKNFGPNAYTCPNIHSFASNQLFKNLNLSSLDLFRNSDDEDEKFLNLISSLQRSTDDMQTNLWNYLNLIRVPIRTFAHRVAPMNKRPVEFINFVSLDELTSEKVILPMFTDYAQLNNPKNVKLLKNMGVIIKTTHDDKIEIVHNPNLAESSEHAKQGYDIVQNLIKVNDLNQNKAKSAPIKRYVTILNLPYLISPTIRGGPSQFGSWPQQRKNKNNLNAKLENFLLGPLVIAKPFDACDNVEEFGYKSPDSLHFKKIRLNDESKNLNRFENKHPIKDSIAVVQRGNCMFVDKARFLQQSGAIGMIVLENANPGSIDNLPPFSMSIDDPARDQSIEIPALFLYNDEARTLLQQMSLIFNRTNSTSSAYMSDNEQLDTMATIALSGAVNPSLSYFNLHQIKDKDYMSLYVKFDSVKSQADIEEDIRGMFYVTKSYKGTGLNFHFQASRTLTWEVFFNHMNIVQVFENYLSKKSLTKECQHLLVKFFELGRLKYLKTDINNGRSIHLPKDWLGFFRECIDDNWTNSQTKDTIEHSELIINYSFYETDYGEENFGSILDQIINVASLKS